jgi:hypothetical protein
MPGKEYQELPENERPQDEVNLADEFAALGKKFAEAMETAWNSDERYRVEREVREGLRKFADEIDGAVKKVRESDVTSRVEESVQRVATDLKSGDASKNVRGGLVTALRSMSEALDKMAQGAEEKEAPKE